MKPSIPRVARTDVPILAFDKLDGSLIRAEWSKKQGFYKFGRKKGLLDHSNPVLLKSPELIQRKYGEQLDRIFRKQRWDQVLAFFEFFGEKSFAGQHDDEDTTFDVVLLDINVHKKGILDPKDFRKMFDSVGMPKVLYEGKANQTFCESVRNGELEGMTFEGVVYKGKNPKRTPVPLMFKLKNKAWLVKLADFCVGDEKLFKQLM